MSGYTITKGEDGLDVITFHEDRFSFLKEEGKLWEGEKIKIFHNSSTAGDYCDVSRILEGSKFEKVSFVFHLVIVGPSVFGKWKELFTDEFILLTETDLSLVVTESYLKSNHEGRNKDHDNLLRYDIHFDIAAKWIEEEYSQEIKQEQGYTKITNVRTFSLRNLGGIN